MSDTLTKEQLDRLEQNEVICKMQAAEILGLQKKLSEIESILTMWWQDTNHDVRDRISDKFKEWKAGGVVEGRETMQVSDTLTFERVE